MEKLEEAEIKQRISIKAAIVLMASLVLYLFTGTIILLHLRFKLSYGPDQLSYFLDGLFMVWVYLQAGQDYIQ